MFAAAVAGARQCRSLLRRRPSVRFALHASAHGSQRGIGRGYFSFQDPTVSVSVRGVSSIPPWARGDVERHLTGSFLPGAHTLCRVQAVLSQPENAPLIEFAVVPSSATKSKNSGLTDPVPSFSPAVLALVDRTSRRPAKLRRAAISTGRRGRVFRPLW
jgi:hypothetical protein